MSYQKNDHQDIEEREEEEEEDDDVKKNVDENKLQGDAPTSSTGQHVFLYSGRWAYRGADGALYLFNNTSNTWEKEDVKVTNNMIRLQQSAYQSVPLSSSSSTTTTTPSTNINNNPPKPNNNQNNNQNIKNGKQDSRGNNKRKQRGGKQQNNRNNNKEEEKEDDQESKEIVDLYIRGLPLDPKLLSSDDLYGIFRKAGFIQEYEDSTPKILFLANPTDGCRTGEAIICFSRTESITLAIQLFDDYDIIPRYKINVSQATPEQVLTRQSADPSKRRKEGIDKKKEMKRELNYGWGDSESRVVVIKNLFDTKESWTNINFYDELKEDLEMGCQRCGEIQSISIFERNPEGVAIIKFKDFTSAEKCVALMDGRFFAQRKLESFLYDGFTDYHVEETEEERTERLKVWEQYLKDEEDKQVGDESTTTTNKLKSNDSDDDENHFHDDE